MLYYVTLGRSGLTSLRHRYTCRSLNYHAGSIVTLLWHAMNHTACTSIISHEINGVWEERGPTIGLSDNLTIFGAIKLMMSFYAHTKRQEFLALCVGNLLMTIGLPSQRSIMWKVFQCHIIVILLDCIGYEFSAGCQLLPECACCQQQWFSLLL